MDDYNDFNEFEIDYKLKGYKLPFEVMEYKFYDIYKGDWKLYLQSIEWDVITPETELEYKIRMEERALAKHPFKKFL